MAYEMGFMNRFYPNIVDVVHRKTSFWELHDYRVIRSVTRFNNMCFIYRGEGRLELDEERHELKPGCFFHISPGMHLNISASQEAPLHYYGVHFYRLQMQWEGGECGAEQLQEGLPLRRVIPFSGASVQKDFAALYETWRNKQADYEWKTKLSLLNLLDRVCDLTITQRQGQSGAAYRQIEEVVRYIRDHYNEPLTRTMLAEKAMMSLSHFAAEFKRVVGVGPHQFIEKLRMDKARTLLTDSSLPIGDIAQLVGYRDPLYFTRAFSKVTGCSPSQYRKG